MGTMDGHYSSSAIPIKVSALFKAETICSGEMTPESYVTVLISRNPRKPLVTFRTPGSPSRAALPTPYQCTKKTILDWAPWFGGSVSAMTPHINMNKKEMESISILCRVFMAGPDFVLPVAFFRTRHHISHSRLLPVRF